MALKVEVPIDQETLFAVMGCLAILWLTMEFVDWFG